LNTTAAGARAASTPSLWQRLGRSARRVGRAALVLVGLYIGFLLCGFIPVNLDYAVPSSGDSVQIFVRSNEIHTDLVLPVRHAETRVDWREHFPPEHFSADIRRDEHVAIGWGNRRFFVETPRWADLKVSAVFGALFWPSESVLHVEYVGTAAPGPTMHAISVSHDQYRELTKFVRSTIAKSGIAAASQNAADGKPAPAKLATDVSYHSRDRFYRSTGRYHLFNTCNQWTGRGLKRAGVPTGIWTPLKPHVLIWIPTEPAN
jgi:uncharacterized protein (TIGR02117 family)